jgi:predicted esterase
MLRTRLPLVLFAAATAFAQITPNDVRYAGLSSRSRLLPYQQSGGDMSVVGPLLAEAQKVSASDATAAYRKMTQALVLMTKTPWTPDAELATGLDFAIRSKVVGTGEPLLTRATYLFDAPAAADGPYRMELDILKADGSATRVERGIELGNVQGRKLGEMQGLMFDPSKLVPPGSYWLRATLKNKDGQALHQYFRSFTLISDLAKRLNALEKSMELAADQKSPAALNIRYVAETLRTAQRSYASDGFQSMLGYLFTGFRAQGMGAAEAMDYNAELTRAEKLATAIAANQDPLKGATGDMRLAYRSAFDGKLIPYRIYVPTNYDASRKWPLIVTLHGAGGDENNFLESYQKLWPQNAEKRGYLIASVNGRGAFGGYLKENGAEKDVLDVLAIMREKYNIDPDRVYLAGHSMGGGGTWRIGLEYRDQFAALAPITAGSPMLDALIAKTKPVPMVIVSGVKDALVPVAAVRANVEKAKAAGYPIEYLEYPDGDHLSVAVTGVNGIFDFFDKHRRATGGSR